MWVLLTRRFRWWLLATVAGPLVGWALDRTGRALEARNGPTRLSGILQSASRRLRRRRDQRDKADAKALDRR